jgi:hypothetical protein
VTPSRTWKLVSTVPLVTAAVGCVGTDGLAGDPSCPSCTPRQVEQAPVVGDAAGIGDADGSRGGGSPDAKAEADGGVDAAASIGPPPPGCTDVLQARAFNADDDLTVAINGTVRVTVHYGKDSGVVNLSPYVVSGANTVELVDTNLGGGYAYAFQVSLNCSVVYSTSCGTVGVTGCPDNGGLTLGVAFRHTLTFVAP